MKKVSETVFRVVVVVLLFLLLGCQTKGFSVEGDQYIDSLQNGPSYDYSTSKDVASLSLNEKLDLREWTLFGAIRAHNTYAANPLGRMLDLEQAQLVPLRIKTFPGGDDIEWVNGDFIPGRAEGFVEGSENAVLFFNSRSETLPYRISEEYIGTEESGVLMTDVFSARDGDHIKFRTKQWPKGAFDDALDLSQLYADADRLGISRDRARQVSATRQFFDYTVSMIVERFGAEQLCSGGFEDFFKELGLVLDLKDIVIHLGEEVPDGFVGDPANADQIHLFFRLDGNSCGRFIWFNDVDTAPQFHIKSKWSNQAQENISSNP